MKRTAFFQALALLVLLGISWVLIALKFKGAEESASPDDSFPQNQEQAPELVQHIPTEIGSAGPGNQQAPNPPEGWGEWIDYIRNQPNAALRRQAIEDLRVSLFSLSKEQAVGRLIEFLDSGFDFPTGLRFQTAKAGTLAGASSLRATLLDWLGQLDPQTAAQVAYKELNSKGTQLHPDVYVIHLRNYGWGTPGNSNSAFIRRHFNLLIDQDSWIANPSPSIGEAMDIAVYLQDPSLVPVLSGIAQSGQDTNLRHAANLALERLFEIDPVLAAQELLESSSGMSLDGRNRASLLARLDPATPGIRQMLEDHLLSNSMTTSEFELFIQYLPNLNISYSYNLLSPEKPITQSIHHTERLRNALYTIEAWQSDPRFSRYMDILNARIETMQVQLYGNPAP